MYEGTNLWIIDSWTNLRIKRTGISSNAWACPPSTRQVGSPKRQFRRPQIWRKAVRQKHQSAVLDCYRENVNESEEDKGIPWCRGLVSMQPKWCMNKAPPERNFAAKRTKKKPLNVHHYDHLLQVCIEVQPLHFEWCVQALNRAMELTDGVRRFVTDSPW